MSNEDGAEKKFDPSSKRLEDLKRKGQILRSRDLNSGLVIMVGVITLSVMSDYFQVQFRHNFTASFSSIATILGQKDHFLAIAGKLAMSNFILILPLLTMVLIASFISAILFGGWNFTLEPLAFNLEKLNPINNLGNLFKFRTIIEIGKSFLKFSLVFLFVLYFFSGHFRDFINLSSLQLNAAVLAGYDLVFSFVWALFITLIFIVAADMAHQYADFMGRNKMSLQELKDENKEAEGSPESKRRQRSVQYALFKQRLGALVPKASVIITNPSHYAVALRYVDGKDKAPKVIAKGKDQLAAQIRSLASAHGIPICPSPALARAIYHTANLGTTIHPDLYMAVAVLLSYVNQLKNYQQGRAKMPTLPEHLAIPDKFVFND